MSPRISFRLFSAHDARGSASSRQPDIHRDRFDSGQAPRLVPAHRPTFPGPYRRIQSLRSHLPIPSLRARGDEKAWTDVVTYVAHPDDHTMYNGGLIGRLTDNGCSVAVVSASHGEGGRMLEWEDGEVVEVRTYPREHVVKVRDGESEVVAEILGHTHEYLYAAKANLDSEFLTSPQQTLRMWNRILPGGVDGFLRGLVRDIRKRRPRVVQTTSPENDPEGSEHGHHRALGLLVDVAARLAADPSYRVDGLEPWIVEELWFFAPMGCHPDEEFRVDGQRRQQALKAHGSQFVLETQSAEPRFFPEHIEELGSREKEGYMLVWRAEDAGEVLKSLVGGENGSRNSDLAGPHS